MPLNVMFTLLVVTATAYLVERGGKLHLAAAGVVFLVGGSSVEYWCRPWLSAWRCGRTRAGRAGPRSRCWPARPCGSSIATCGPCSPAGALPGLAVDVRVPRLRWAFYAYYPLHLASLWLIRIPMSKAGYLFF
ncbi:TraX family protein [Burkholderia plantarii]|uniref:TraX family protein n=1 Tax=Burkholderia plantarii TaxID=41899 RepID=UPI002413C29D|nr:TraX family protein [Burkholderia plantarii]